MRVSVWLAVLGVPLTVQAQKDLASCKTAMDAALKTAATPHHAYTITTQGSKTRPGESIVANGKTYVLLRGAWQTSRLSVADIVKREQENIDSATVYTCHAVKEEAAGGQVATVYQVRTENMGVKSDGQVWVARGPGLVMRVEQDVDTGDAGSKMHVSTKYDYSNVKAPPGV